MDIEKLATSAVEDAIARTDYIVPYLKSGDREPCWDGYLYAYSDLSKQNNSFIGKAPVQVKGQSCEQFSNDKIKYLVRKIDLRNYCIEGGTIYFVVQINKNGEKKIFYNSLLPFELNKILEGSEKKNKISVEMHEFPSNSNEITNIILNFVRDKESQVLIRNGTNISIDDIIKKLGTDNLQYSFSYTGLGYSSNEPYKYLLNHDIYIYAEYKDINIKVPVEHVWRADICQSEILGEIKVGDKVFYDHYNIVHKKNSDAIHIGKSIVMERDEKGVLNLRYKLDGNLDEQILAERMMIEFIKKKEISVNGVRLGGDPFQEGVKKFNLEGMEAHSKYLVELKNVLTSLGVNIPLECSNLSKKDEEYIKILILSQKYGQAIKFKEKNIFPLSTLRIGNLKIMLYFNLQKNGKYLLQRYDNCNVNIMGEYEDKTIFPTSKYTVMKVDDFLNVSNLNEHIIVDELISINNKGHILRTIFTLLEMIKAYDINKKQGLLEEAFRLAKWIYDIEKTDITIINMYQCLIRQRKLTDEEEEELENIFANNRDKLQIKAAVYILLGKWEKACKTINKLSIEEKREFVNYPIYSLLKKADSIK